MGVEKDKENIHVDPMLLFSRLLALIERERERERERGGDTRIFSIRT